MPRCFAPPPFRSFLDGQSIDVPSNVGRNGLVRTRRSKSGPRISLPVGLIRGGTTHRRVTRDQLLFYHESFLHRFRIVPFFASARISRARDFFTTPITRSEERLPGILDDVRFPLLGQAIMQSDLPSKSNRSRLTDFPSVVSITVTAIEWNR